MSERKFAKMLRDPIKAIIFTGFFGAVASELYHYMIYTAFVQPPPLSVDMILRVAWVTFIFYLALVALMAGLIKVGGR